MKLEANVEKHYSNEDLGPIIDDALRRAGRDPTRITHRDLEAVDLFHIRGREATVELAELAGIDPEATVLDIGSGVGGTARYLASEHGCRVSGIDLTATFCSVARALSARVGLGERTTFQQASALDLPFHENTFDLVWTEHVQMNIEDKDAFYAEAVRVLKPGGKLVFHDIFAGPAGTAHYPAPWAGTADISFLASPEHTRRLLADLGMRAEVWRDSTERSLAWFDATVARLDRAGPPPLGLHLLMGTTARQKLGNVGRSLRENRLLTVQAVLTKGAS